MFLKTCFLITLVIYYFAGDRSMAMIFSYFGPIFVYDRRHFKKYRTYEAGSVESHFSTSLRSVESRWFIHHGKQAKRLFSGCWTETQKRPFNNKGWSKILVTFARSKVRRIEIETVRIFLWITTQVFNGGYWNMNGIFQTTLA